jgi:hypothetical protein
MIVIPFVLFAAALAASHNENANRRQIAACGGAQRKAEAAG